MKSPVVMQPACDYWVGVDGGGSKTLVRLTRADGSVLAQASGAASPLRYGVAKAWQVIVATIERAFATAGVPLPPLHRLAVGVGVSGFNVLQWAQDFQQQAPGFGQLRLASDAFTTLLGAHQGQPGVIVAVGTGSIGMAWYPDGSQRVTDGWGFPSGDDGSGAWIGLRAINHVQRTLDGRTQAGALAAAVLAFCAGAAAGNPRDSLLDWLSKADQGAFARLARLVVAGAETDQVAQRIMHEAALEVQSTAVALDPDQCLPLALCGGLAPALAVYLPAQLRQRALTAKADAAAGALLLLRQSCSRSHL